MAIKFIIPGRKDPVIRAAIIAFLTLSLIVAAFFTFFYVKYDRIIAKRFSEPVFSSSAKIYGGPQVVRVGEAVDVREIASQLRRAGYSDKDQTAMGSFRLRADSIEIHPGAESYHSPDPAVITVSRGKVESIRGGGVGDLLAYELEPELITSLFDSGQRSKRQIVTYDQIPKVMVDAVLAIEDRRFFTHNGVNFIRLAEAAVIDITHMGHKQGGSTITMQLSRAFFLTPEKTFKRKLVEMMIAMQLEQKFSKQQIFEFYANRVDMGQRGSFTIAGFAEASRSYFNKNLKDISLPEAALLAGLIQAPSALSPYRHPERALERRNTVLDAMYETGSITHVEAERAKAAPLRLAPPNVEASDAPYFIDLVRDTVISKLNEREVNDQAYRIYTTLDPDLQKAAAHAVEVGINLVDDQVTRLRTRKVKISKGKYETKVAPGPQAQVALVAIDPHTGRVLALVGGRNYGTSQLNHAISKRPTGSIFKPFVYAAAVSTAVNGSATVFTPASTVTDAPTTFSYGDQIYEPRNYKEEYHGDVTLRYALALSLNNATVKLAEEVGYDKVAELARNAGIASVKPLPAMALGSYDATPLDMASAYTAFANNGTRISTTLVSSVRNARGDVVMDFPAQKRDVLDPRVAYIMTNMMEGVMNFGTAFGVRSRGFNTPAAGKTGTSHDGWFAGYTSNLLCIVWVGYDDYSDIHLSGAQSALPIWTEFMKKAVTLPQYSNAGGFSPPAGVVAVALDKTTNRLPTPACPETYTISFIEGTEPKESCDQTLGQQGIFSRIFGSDAQKPGAPPDPSQAANPEGQDPAKKKKGFFGKIVGVFKGEDKNAQPAKPVTPAPVEPPH